MSVLSLDIRGQVYGYEGGITQSTISEAANRSYLEKTQAIAFETGNDVDALQMLYDQGWGNRGFNLFVENGKLYAGLYDNAQQDWGYRELEVDIAANTKYTAALVIDGAVPADGTAQLYLNGELVDTVDGVGQLQEHGTEIGVGEVHEYTAIHNQRTDNVDDFEGSIEKLVQYDNALSADDLGQLEAAMASGFTVPVVTEEPVVEETVVEDRDISEVRVDQGPSIDLPVAPTQRSGNQESGGDVNNTDIRGGGTTTVTGGRVTTLDIPQNNVADVRIISNVNHGNVTVNPDNSLALVMTQSDFTGRQSFSYEVTYNNGSTSRHTTNLNVTSGTQRGGWGTGEDQYMLATDANDKIIAEAGDNHVTVYVSGSRDALSFADIARMEGIPTSRVNGNWLANQDRYGQSEEFALNESAGRAMWNAVTPSGSTTSNHLLLERGYEYDVFGRTIVNDRVSGESELNPVLVGAYGEGDKPEVTTGFGSEGRSQNLNNIVFQDLEFSYKVSMRNSDNIIFDNITVQGQGPNGGAKTGFENVDGLTFHNSEFYDIWSTSPSRITNSGQTQSWHDRSHGIYISNSDGALLEGNFFDHNGWNPNYNPNSEWGSGQSPSTYSHNVYIQYNNEDVTVRDNVSARSAADGLKVRSGGFIENNTLIDNNIGIVTLGGDYLGRGGVGQYSLLSDNVTTEASGRRTSATRGANSWGVWDRAEQTSHVDNIITHLADPNTNETKYTAGPVRGLNNEDPNFYNDTIIYNWDNNPNVSTAGSNVGNLDRNALDQTTIQRFSEQLLDDPDADIEELLEYIRANTDGQTGTTLTADDINRFFQEGFGIAPDVRTESTTLRFIPNELGEGVRWDNKLNWSTDDLPGVFAGDDVDLGGNHVVVGTNTIIDTLDLSGGDLTVYGGRLIVTGGIVGEGGTITVEGAGQLFIAGNSGGNVTVNVTGGRFVNTESNANLRINDRGGEVINDRNMDLTDFIPDHAARSNSSGNGSSVSLDLVSVDSIEGVSSDALVYGYMDSVTRGTISEAANRSYLEKTQAIAFETGNNVEGLQMLYDQGWGNRGFNLFVENGKLYAGLYDNAQQDWGYRELEVDIAANTKYTAALVIDGAVPADGTAQLYLNGELVDTVDGVGQLQEHGTEIGIGEVHEYTAIHNQRTDNVDDFEGSIEKLVQYDSALSADDLSHLETAMASGFTVPVVVEEPVVEETVVEAPAPVVETPQEPVHRELPDNAAFSFTDGNAPNRLQDDIEINMGFFLQKTHAMAFETGSNIDNLQMLYEQGGGIRGLNMFVQDGKLYAGLWNRAEENWGYRELDVDVAANTKYTATIVMDGQIPANGTADLYLNGELVDSVDGIGQLYRHGDDIGIGQVNNHTRIHGRFFNRSADFTGEIETVIQYNDALAGNDLSALHAVLAEGYLNVAVMPDPIIEPEPEPVVSEPEPVVEVVPEPEPVPQPASKPVAQPAPEPEPVVPEPVVEAEPEPIPQPAPKPPVAPEQEQQVYEETNKNDETSSLESLSKVFEAASLGDIFVDLNEIKGTEGNDSLRGTDEQNDLIDAGGGRDRIFSEDGNDVIRAGAGDDRVYGMDGNDIIHGGAGNDQILAGPGDDTIILGEGRDRAWGDQGKDTFIFESFDAHVDTVFGFETGAGGDVINLTDVLENFDPLMDDILSVVQMEERFGNTEIQINAGSGFTTIAVVEGGVSGMTVNDLVEAGNLVVDQTVYLV